MKAGFIGLGRMGQVMVRRLLDAGHEVGVFNRTPGKAGPLTDAGAKPMELIAQAAEFGECVFTMLADDAAALSVAGELAGVLARGGVHVCAGTHSVKTIQALTDLHQKAGQVLIAAPMLGRPQVVASGQAGMVLGGAADILKRLHPLFGAIARRTFEAGLDPASAAAIKIANNFVLGCAIEALGEGFSLVRKYNVVPSVFHDVLTDGLFGCSAYKVYGQIIAEERYQPAGQSVTLGLKDANLALAAAEVVGVPLPSTNIWRDRLVAAQGRGEGDHDWAAMAREQARASGLK